MRDFQKQKVYDWEDEFVRPKINNTLRSCEYLQMLVNHMWGQLDLTNAPTVYNDLSYKRKSTGNRYEIRLMDTMMDEFVVAHELAHSLNLCEHRNVFDHHGPKYVADYCRILTKFYGFDINYLLYTLNKDGVKIDLGTYYGKL